ncbi:hypothetical protein C0Q70_17787 [Pomacea canaliculata]|uniref:Uncharacterized protein n=1 Tax=Pomacea canaliculata TaxID=400727 RepID=A0A2T7NLE1_POMCA|nr:hypothetical protein C0Q70_17787 [Pomacea canaliculata]
MFTHDDPKTQEPSSPDVIKIALPFTTMSMAAAAMEAIEGSLGDFIDNTIVRCVYEYEVQRNDKDSLVKRHLVQSVPPVSSPRGFADKHEGRRLSGMNKNTWGKATQPCRQVSGMLSSSVAEQSFKEQTSVMRQPPSPALKQSTSTTQLSTTGLPPSTTALQQLTSTSQLPTTALHSSGSESATRLACEQGTVVHEQFPDSAVSTSENPASEKSRQLSLVCEERPPTNSTRDPEF